MNQNHHEGANGTNKVNRTNQLKLQKPNKPKAKSPNIPEIETKQQNNINNVSFGSGTSSQVAQHISNQHIHVHYAPSSRTKRGISEVSDQTSNLSVPPASRSRQRSVEDRKNRYAVTSEMRQQLDPSVLRSSHVRSHSQCSDRSIEGRPRWHGPLWTPPKYFLPEFEKHTPHTEHGVHKEGRTRGHHSREGSAEIDAAARRAWSERGLPKQYMQAEVVSLPVPQVVADEVALPIPTSSDSGSSEKRRNVIPNSWIAAAEGVSLDSTVAVGGTTLGSAPTTGELREHESYVRAQMMSANITPQRRKLSIDVTRTDVMPTTRTRPMIKSARTKTNIEPYQKHLESSGCYTGADIMPGSKTREERWGIEARRRHMEATNAMHYDLAPKPKSYKLEASTHNGHVGIEPNDQERQHERYTHLGKEQTNGTSINPKASSSRNRGAFLQSAGGVEKFSIDPQSLSKIEYERRHLTKTVNDAGRYDVEPVLRERHLMAGKNTHCDIDPRARHLEASGYSRYDIEPRNMSGAVNTKFEEPYLANQTTIQSARTKPEIAARERHLGVDSSTYSVEPARVDRSRTKQTYKNADIMPERRHMGTGQDGQKEPSKSISSEISLDARFQRDSHGWNKSVQVPSVCSEKTNESEDRGILAVTSILDEQRNLAGANRMLGSGKESRYREVFNIVENDAFNRRTDAHSAASFGRGKWSGDERYGKSRSGQRGPAESVVVKSEDSDKSYELSFGGRRDTSDKIFRQETATFGTKKSSHDDEVKEGSSRPASVAMTRVTTMTRPGALVSTFTPSGGITVYHDMTRPGYTITETKPITTPQGRETFLEMHTYYAPNVSTTVVTTTQDGLIVEGSWAPYHTKVVKDRVTGAQRVIEVNPKNLDTAQQQSWMSVLYANSVDPDPRKYTVFTVPAAHPEFVTGSTNFHRIYVPTGRDFVEQTPGGIAVVRSPQNEVYVNPGSSLVRTQTIPVNTSTTNYSSNGPATVSRTTTKEYIPQRQNIYLEQPHSTVTTTTQRVLSPPMSPSYVGRTTPVREAVVVPVPVREAVVVPTVPTPTMPTAPMPNVSTINISQLEEVRRGAVEPATQYVNVVKHSNPLTNVDVSVINRAEQMTNVEIRDGGNGLTNVDLGVLNQDTMREVMYVQDEGVANQVITATTPEFHQVKYLHTGEQGVAYQQSASAQVEVVPNPHYYAEAHTTVRAPAAHQVVEVVEQPLPQQVIEVVKQPSQQVVEVLQQPPLQQVIEVVQQPQVALEPHPQNVVEVVPNNTRMPYLSPQQQLIELHHPPQHLVEMHPQGLIENRNHLSQHHFSSNAGFGSTQQQFANAAQFGGAHFGSPRMHQHFGSSGMQQHFGASGAHQHFGSSGAHQHFGSSGAHQHFGASGSSTHPQVVEVVQNEAYRAPIIPIKHAHSMPQLVALEQNEFMSGARQDQQFVSMDNVKSRSKSRRRNKDLKKLYLDGWLRKQGGNLQDSFKTRWCVLKNGILSYYMDQSVDKTGDAKGSIELNARSEIRLFSDSHCTREAKMLKNKHPHGFEIYNGKKTRVFYFDAGTRPKLIAWVQALEDVIDAKIALEDGKRKK